MKKNLVVVLLLSIAETIFAQSQPYLFVFLNKKTSNEELPKEQLDKLMEGHMANINRLATEGKLTVAGPFDGGGGIFILNTSSKEEATKWLSTDPGIQAKRWDIELLPFTVRYGSVCKASPPYEMVSYHFVRYTANLTKYNVADAGNTFKSHDDYLKSIIKTGNVIIEGIFGDREGGILLVKGDLQKEVIERDPAILENLFYIDFKKLWVAKGSFCEK